MTRFALGAMLGAFLATCPVMAQEPAAPADRWSVTAAPYLWAARLDGDAEVRGIKADITRSAWERRPVRATRAKGSREDGGATNG